MFDAGIPLHEYRGLRGGLTLLTGEHAPRSRWNRLLIALSVGLAALLLAAGACGGDDEEKKTDGGGTAAATTTSEGGFGEEITPTEGEDGGNEEDTLAQLENLGSGLENVTGKVTYNIVGDDGSTTSMTFYAKPPNSRFDSTDSGGTTSIIISTPDNMYICGSDSQSCLGYPGSGADTSSLGGFGALLSPEVINTYIQLADAAGVDVNKSDESIGGIDATCYSWEDDTSGDVERFKWCFNDAGIMVYEEIVSSGSTTKLTASEVSSDVSDSDFEPPYDVITVDIPTP